MSTEYNTNGLGNLQQYGEREVDEKRGGLFASKNNVKTAEWVFDYDDLPTYSLSELEQSIPANATIVSAKLRVLTAFTSTSTTTDLVVGLYQADSTVIDADGLLTAVNLDQAAIAVVGGLVTGTGALVSTTIGAAAGELVVAPTVDDLLTGRAVVTVEYTI